MHSPLPRRVKAKKVEGVEKHQPSRLDSNFTRYVHTYVYIHVLASKVTTVIVRVGPLILGLGLGLGSGIGMLFEGDLHRCMPCAAFKEIY
jgi:hypothetical protein